SEPPTMMRLSLSRLLRPFRRSPRRPQRPLRSWPSRPLEVMQFEDRVLPASSITVIPGLSGSGNLDSFLIGSGGSVTHPYGGASPGTLSTGALAAIPAVNNISVTAQTSITFNDLTSQGGTLNLPTSASHSATFTAQSVALTFANLTNVLNTAGGALTLAA